MIFAKTGKLSVTIATEIIKAVEAAKAEDPLLSDACACINAGTSLARYKYAVNLVTGQIKYDRPQAAALAKLEHEEANQKQVEMLREELGDDLLPEEDPAELAEEVEPEPEQSLQWDQAGKVYVIVCHEGNVARIVKDLSA